MSEIKDKILVLCVDRDDDIGIKVGIGTPIFGREKNLDAALKLVLIDPEESDANAIFGAIQTYDHLSSDMSIDESEIVTISGSNKGGVEADKKIRDQLIEVQNQFPANTVILVTDGFSDEAVIPIIQSRLPILSVQRIVVRHSESLEESWAVFTRYLSRVLTDPYYSRWILGAPGLLLLVMGIIWQFVEFVNPGVMLILVLGTFLIVKGFGIDRSLSEFIYPSPPNIVRLFTTSVSLIIGGLALNQTYGILYENFGSITEWLELLPTVIGYALRYSVDLLVISLCIFIGGLGVYLYFMRDPRMLWSVVGLVVAVLMRIISLKVSEILLLPPPVPDIYWIEISAIIALSIVTTIIVIFVTLRQGKHLEEYFVKTEE